MIAADPEGAPVAIGERHLALLLPRCRRRVCGPGSSGPASLV